MGTCERPTHNPLGEHIAAPCTADARVDVLYRIKTEELPRGIRVCLEHLDELKEMRKRGMIADWDVKAITR